MSILQRSLALVLVLASNLSLANVTVQTVTEDNPPSMACTNTGMTIAGQLSAANYGFIGTSFTVSGFTIDIEVEYSAGIIVLPAITPFSQSVNLGMLPAGTYTVNTHGVLNGVTTSTFTSTLNIISCCSAVPSYTLNSDTICLGDSVHFANTSTGAISFEWFKDNVSLGSVNTIDEELNSVGTYTYKLVVDAATCSDSLEQEIVVIDYPNLSLGNDTTMCGFFALVLEVPPGINNILWSTGSTNQWIAVNTSGTYSVEGDIAGCYSYDTINVNYEQNSTTTDVHTACNSFTWIDGATYTSSNNTATYILTNAVGCDSIITLDLTLSTVNTGVTQTGGTFQSAMTGGTYQWLDCNNGYSAIAGETNQTFTPTSNGSYAVEVDNGTCIDTSACYLINDVGISENKFGSGFVLTPNPINELVYVKLGKYIENVNVNIHDATGRMIYSKYIGTTSELTLQPNLKSGVYFITIMSEGNSRTLRFVK